jgi:peptidoglycan/LPS O-acetylase OafA/YrhL
MGEAGPIVSEEAQGGRIAAIQLLRALAALVVAAGHIAFAFADHLPGGLGLAPVPPTTWVMGFDYLYWAALPAALLAFVALSGPLALPAARIVNRAGDASYALYLLHVPVAWFWLWFWGRLPFFDAGPWDYCISALAGAVAVSWLFHVHVERPMTLALNRWLAAPHRAEALSRKTP